MSISRKQLEAISITGQNEAIALAQVYRESFRQSLEKETTIALNQEISTFLQEKNEVAATIVNTIAQAYAESIGEATAHIPTIKLLKPVKSDRAKRSFPLAEIEALLPVEKPRRLRSVG